jgi:hypothetical protein
MLVDPLLNTQLTRRPPEGNSNDETTPTDSPAEGEFRRSSGHYCVYYSRFIKVKIVPCLYTFFDTSMRCVVASHTPLA